MMIKKLIKKTPLYTLLVFYRRLKEKKKNKAEIKNIISGWEKSGRPVPPPHIIKINTIKSYGKKYKIDTLIETGTFLGETLDACKKNFKKLISIELSEELFERAKLKFANDKNVFLYKGDSGMVLREILPQITTPSMFWLDGHYSEWITAKGQLNTPILNELKHIFQRPLPHVILIDDARYFTGNDDYPTIDELKQIISNYNVNLKFYVENDIIRIHH